MAIYFNDNFNGYADNTLLSAVNSAFTIVSGTDDVSNGMLVQSGRVVSAFSKAPTYRFLLPGHPTDSYAVEFDLYINLTGAISACWPRMNTSNTEGYRLLYSAGNLRLQRITSGFSITSLGTGVTLADTAGITYKIRAEVDGSDFRVYVDDVLRETIADSTYTTGVIALYANSNKAQFDRLLLEDLGGDTTAPTLTSPTASATGATTASGSVTTNEGNGTLYYLASANATELAATVKAGSSQAVTAAGEQPVTITGLTAEAPYYPHFLHRDAAGNDSAVASGAQFTTSATNTSPSFTGPNIADISGTEGVALTPVDVSARFFDSESGLTFSAVGSWPAGVTVSSAGVISGTPTTAGTYASLQVRATDAGSLTADSNAFAITVAAPGDAENPTLTGAVTFASVTQTSYTAQWPAGSDNVAVTGYEYQIGSTAGAWTDAGNNLSAAITGRTAGATETVYVRAYDAAGLRSTPAISGSVTLLSATTDGTITVGSALYPIKYSSASALNESGLRATVLDATTFAEVLNTSGVVCNAGVITITDAAIVIGNTYHLVVKTANGWTGCSDVVTAS